MAQEKFNFFPFLPTELLEQIFAFANLSDILSLFIALGPNLNIQNNNIKELLPDAIKMLPIEDRIDEVKTTNEQSYCMLDLAMRKKCGKGYLECDEKIIFLLIKSIQNAGNIGKLIFEEGKYFTYWNLPSESKMIAQGALCSGIISVDDGLLDVSKDIDKNSIKANLSKDTIKPIMDGIEAIFESVNLTEAIENQDFEKAKMAIDKGADLTDFNNWHYKTFSPYSDIREVLKIISYMNRKSCDVKTRIDAKNIIKAAEYGDSDILKLLYNQYRNVSQNIKNEAYEFAVKNHNDEIIDFLHRRGAELPKKIELSKVANSYINRHCLKTVDK